MSDLGVVVSPTESKPEEDRQKLLIMQKQYLIELRDAVIAVKGTQGRFKFDQLIITSATGAVSGTWRRWRGRGTGAAMCARLRSAK